MSTDCGPLEKSANLLMLPAAETEEIEQALAGLQPGWILSRVRVERFLAGGYSNRNYRIAYNEQRFVLRLPGAQSATDFKAELTVLQGLQNVFDLMTPTEVDLGRLESQPAPIGMTLAETVAVDVARGWLLTRWVERPVLANSVGVSGVQLGHYLAALHRRLQQLPGQLGRSEDDRTHTLKYTILADLDLLYQEPVTRQKLHQHLQLLLEKTSPLQVCHIDLNPWNLLFDHDNGWVTLDWETLGLAPPLFDLVVLCEGYALNHGYAPARAAELAQTCLVTYNQCMHTHYSTVELDLLRSVFHWREYAWAAARLQQGSLRPAVHDDVLQQRRNYSALLKNQAHALELELVLD